jgi:hypothetical protein
MIYPEKGFINVINPSSSFQKPFLDISQFPKPLQFREDNEPFAGLLFVFINARRVYHLYKNVMVHQNATYKGGKADFLGFKSEKIRKNPENPKKSRKSEKIPKIRKNLKIQERFSLLNDMILS